MVMTADAASAAPPAPRPARAWTAAVVVVVVAGIALGAFLRAWYLTHNGVDSDEAVVGLMAQGILHGHSYIFYWGQVYGGAPEAYVVAAMFVVFGVSGLVLNLTAAALSAVAALITWRVAARIVQHPWVAALAGVLVWVGPEAWIWYSTTEDGFRRVTMIAGLVCALLALRILDGHRGVAEFVGLGLAAGIGWWSSPELAYFLAPTALVLLAAVAGRGSVAEPLRRWIPRAGVVLLSFLVAALPWLWANVGSGFASMSSANASNNGTTYSRRLSNFFDHSIPIETNLAYPGSGTPLTGAPGTPEWHHLFMLALIAVCAVVLVGAFVLCVASWGRAAAIAAGVAAYPFIYAENPTTWFWNDGRYASYLVPLLAVMLAAGVEEGLARLGRAQPTKRWPLASARRRAGLALMAGIVAFSAILTVVSFQRVGLEHVDAFGISHATTDVDAASLTSGWQGPGAGLRRYAGELEADGLTRGYASYWVAYDLDFYGGGRLAIAGDPVRSSALMSKASRGSGQAWLYLGGFAGFVPQGLNEAQLVERLHHLDVAYRVVTLGGLTAIVPRGISSLAEMGVHWAGG
jgi:hypothetical protein